ncbi:hypothetical protein AAAC51_07000 [Priestia megaterium]
MKIYRGNVGVELSLDEFYYLIADEENVDDLLNLIYDLEMDEVMNYNSEDIKRFENELFKEMAEYKEKQHSSDNIGTIKRILKHLEKYD